MVMAKLLELLGSRMFTGAGLAAFSTGSYVVYTDSTRYIKVGEAFSHGSVRPPLSDTTYQTHYLPRPQEEAKIRRILQPRFTNEYYFVYGEVGTGKTRLVLETVRELMASSGKKSEGAPVYVLASQGKSFSDTLAASVNFSFDEHISFRFFLNYMMGLHSMPSKNENHKLQRVLDAIEEAAFFYMRKHGRPAVLVIDDTNYLATHSPDILGKIQEKAKLWADTNIVKVVFISNDEHSEVILQGNQSSWSRADNPLYIGDLSKEDAVQFLLKTSPNLNPNIQKADSTPNPMDMTPVIDHEMAVRITELVGGRVQHLLHFRRDIAEGAPFETTSARLRGKEREKLLTVQKSDPAMEAVARLMAEPSRKMTIDKFMRLLTLQEFSCLVKQNILSIYREGERLVVKFDSQLMENVIREWLNVKEVQK